MSEKATFSAGCFWGVEDAFRTVDGVLNVTVGYTGGTLKDPTYEQVCTGRTGHAESVLVEFDPAVVSYDHLLEVFLSIHDPTTLNRQGPDVGSQYRSVIFYHTPEQMEKALSAIRRAQKSGRYADKPIVTEVLAASTFFPAEEYHQRFHEKHGLKSCGIHRASGA